MPIISMTFGTAGQNGMMPRRVSMTTTDDLSMVTEAGYLDNQKLSPNQINPTDILDIVYSFDATIGTGSYQEFLPSFNGSVITLAQNLSEGNVTLPVVSGNFSVFNGTLGVIKDAGYAPSDATKTTVVMAGSAVVANRLAHFVDTTGTIDDTAANVTNLGDIYAGASGTAGAFRSYASAATTGYLSLTAVENAADYAVLISNASHGQSTTYSIGDIGASTGGLVAATAAIRMKAVAGAAAAGGAAAQSFTDAFCTSGSCVVGNWNTQANPVEVLKIVPGNGSFVVTSSGDAGVGTFNYIITK